MKIMIVDNELIRTRGIRSILANIGYKSGEVDSFDEITAGLNELKKKRFDVVFISLDIPEKGGPEMLKEMRETGRLKSVPVVAYSSEVSHALVMESVKMGANAFLSYPCSVSDVEGVLEQAVPKKR